MYLLFRPPAARSWGLRRSVQITSYAFFVVPSLLLMEGKEAARPAQRRVHACAITISFFMPRLQSKAARFNVQQGRARRTHTALQQYSNKFELKMSCHRSEVVDK